MHWAKGAPFLLQLFLFSEMISYLPLTLGSTDSTAVARKHEAPFGFAAVVLPVVNLALPVLLSMLVDHTCVMVTGVLWQKT